MVKIASEHCGLPSTEVNLCELLRPHEPYAQLAHVLERLSDLGYYDRDVDLYWNQALVKFWFAQSLGDLPVYPTWLMVDAVARALENPPKQWKEKDQQRWAFVMPGSSPPELTAEQKKTYISRKAFSITKGRPSAIDSI